MMHSFRLNLEKITEPRNIKIDVNHPESLPVPKLLRSFVVYGDGLITSSEAFDKLATDVNKEIMLEIPSLNDLSDRFFITCSNNLFKSNYQ